MPPFGNAFHRFMWRWSSAYRASFVRESIIKTGFPPVMGTDGYPLYSVTADGKKIPLRKGMTAASLQDAPQQR